MRPKPEYERQPAPVLANAPAVQMERAAKRLPFFTQDRDQSASNTPAAPMPVPMHMVTMPYFC